MAQKLRDDKIGTLQHNAGNIQMLASVSNPAYLTIGGQQYKVTTNLTVALPALTANSRYQVFAVNNAGTIELRISTNENSVGPTGFNRWKLIGSLISNRLSAFGSFNDINSITKHSLAHYITAGTPGASPSIANNTLSTLIYGTVVTDTEGNYNTANGEYIIPFTGEFDISFKNRTTGTYPSQGNIDARIYKNGTLWREIVSSESGGSAGQMTNGVEWSGAELAAGDIITFRILPTSWTSTSFVNASTDHWFTIKGVKFNLTAPIKDL